MKKFAQNNSPAVNRVAVNSVAEILRLIFLVLFILLASSTLVSCKKADNISNLAERMAEEDGRSSDDERIRELKSQIRAVDRQAEKIISQVRDKGTFYRLLGLKFMDYSMWGEALEAFNEAVLIYPDHAALQYNRALCTAQMALSVVDSEERSEYLSMAEAGYRRSIAIDERYTPALYALSVLLVFELGRPLEAAPFLDQYLAIERSAISPRFLRARVYLEAGRPGEALKLYEEIIRLAKNDIDVAKARELHNSVSGGQYGS